MCGTGPRCLDHLIPPDPLRRAMPIRTGIVLTYALLAVVSLTAAQPPVEPHQGRLESADDFVTRMMAWDKDQDGKLTLIELTDPRLHRLFDRADANKDRTVTRPELSAL